MLRVRETRYTSLPKNGEKLQQMSPFSIFLRMELQNGCKGFILMAIVGLSGSI